jgi:hypothetical protein
MAAEIITKHFERLGGGDPQVSGREAGVCMVAIYYLLTDEMPQSPGIDPVLLPQTIDALLMERPNSPTKRKRLGVKAFINRLRSGETKHDEKSD